MDIYSKGEYPSNVLSNFYEHHFIIDDVECYSMEGFMQSLKFRNHNKQKQICKTVGYDAKSRGNRDWQKTGILYWQNKEYFRDSVDYTVLITSAYTELFNQSEEFRKALLSTKGTKLTHSINGNNKSKTILTEDEFCIILTNLRDNE